jgi:hypothetical protein
MGNFDFIYGEFYLDLVICMLQFGFLMNWLFSGIYGAMAVAGSFICSITGIDSLGGFHLSLDAVLEGLGYAVPPIMALLFILDVSLFIY